MLASSYFDTFTLVGMMSLGWVMLSSLYLTLLPLLGDGLCCHTPILTHLPLLS